MVLFKEQFMNQDIPEKCFIFDYVSCYKRITEAPVRECFTKQVLLKITQKSQENTSLQDTCGKLLLKFIHYIVNKLLINTVNELYIFL